MRDRFGMAFRNGRYTTAVLAGAIAALMAAGGLDASAGTEPPTVPEPIATEPSADVAPVPEFGAEEFGLTDDELAARVTEVESEITACIAAAGFEYTSL